MLHHVKVDPVDFARILNELIAGGMAFPQIKASTGIPETTLKSYRNNGVEPSHLNGAKLIKLWSDMHLGANPPTIATPRKQTTFRLRSSIQLSLIEG